MKRFQFCLFLVIAAVLVGVCLKNAEAFVFTEQLPVSSKPTYIEAQLVLDQSQQIDPAYVRAITQIANFLGANVSQKQVEQALRRKWMRI
jgi:hypothetical protein